jgi:hypothetical protein
LAHADKFKKRKPMAAGALNVNQKPNKAKDGGPGSAMGSVHFMREHGSGDTVWREGLDRAVKKERKSHGEQKRKTGKKRSVGEALSSPEMPFMREKGSQDSLPAALVGLAAERVT